MIIIIVYVTYSKVTCTPAFVGADYKETRRSKFALWYVKRFHFLHQYRHHNFCTGLMFWPKLTANENCYRTRRMLGTRILLGSRFLDGIIVKEFEGNSPFQREIKRREMIYVYSDDSHATPRLSAFLGKLPPPLSPK